MDSPSEKFCSSRLIPGFFILGIICCFACFGFPLLNRERGMADLVMEVTEGAAVVNGVLPAERLYARGAAWCLSLCGTFYFPERETLVRLPAFLGALLTLGAVCYLLRRREAAARILAVLMLGGSYGFLHWARLAGPEMLETALYTWILALLFSDGQRHRTIVALLALAGLLLWQWHFLILLTALPVIFQQRFTARAFQNWLLTFLALAAAAALTVFIFYKCGFEVRWLIPPPYPRLLSWAEAVSRHYGCGALIQLPRLLLPWTPLALGVLVQFCRLRSRGAEVGAEGRELGQWLLALGVPALVLALALPLECRRSWEDWLPLLPALTAVCAAGLRQYRSFPDDRMRQFYYFAVSVTASAAMAAFVTWPVWKRVLGKTPDWRLLACSFVLGAFVLWLQNLSLDSRNPGRRQDWSRVVFNTALLSLFIQAILQPLASDFRYERTYWLECRARLNNSSPARLIFCSDDRSEPDGIGRFYLQLSEKELKCRFRVKTAAEAAEKAGKKGAWVFLDRSPELETDLKQYAEVFSKPAAAPDAKSGPAAAETSPLRFFDFKNADEASSRRLYWAVKKGKE